MQIVSIGDNLHEMPNTVFWEKYEKYFNMLKILLKSAKPLGVFYYDDNSGIIFLFLHKNIHLSQKLLWSEMVPCLPWIFGHLNSFLAFVCW